MESNAESHHNLLQQIQDELDRNLQKYKDAELRIRDMKKAGKEARKSIHKERLAAIHKAEKDIHAAKTEAQGKAAKARLKKAQDAYHSGLKKIHVAYRPGGGSYQY